MKTKTSTEIIEMLYETLLAVYSDIDISNVQGGSDELNVMVNKALEEKEMFIKSIK